MPPLRLRSCHACRLRKVRCIYPEGQEKTCERCRDAGAPCIPAAKTTRKSNWRRSVDEALAQSAPADGSSGKYLDIKICFLNLHPVETDIQPPLASPHDLPNYIKPIPTQLSISAITYLQEVQAFTIPNDEIRDAILESYFEFYHTSLPLIDPCEFAESIRRNDGGLSLLLLQSMLFAGIAYVDLSILQQLGLSTRKDARKVFFERARLLHECDCEDDRYISAQALLLLSNWYEPTDRKETSYWVGCAISAMQTLPQSTFSASRANRRLWWSIYLRDRSINWSARRPLRLHAGDYHVQELTLEDFFTEPSGFYGSRFVRNPEDQEDNALICMELIKLHTTISDLVLVGPRIQEYAVPSDLAEDSLQSSDIWFAEYLKWPSRLPESLQYHSPSGVIRSRCVSAQLSFMHLIYWTSLIQYCELLPANTMLPAHSSGNTTSPTTLSNHAIHMIHSIFQDVKENRYLPYLPLSGVAILFKAIAPLIRQLEVLPSLNSFTLSRYLAELMDTMQSYRSTYTIAQHVFKVFCLALRQIIFRDASQVLFLDQTDISAWTIENPDSTEEIDKLYTNIRKLLPRMKTEDSIPNLPANSFFTPPSSTSGQTPDSAQPKIPLASSTPATELTSASEAMDAASFCSFQQQMPYTSGYLIDETMGGVLEAGFDSRDLMSNQQFVEFCAQFGLTDELEMRFS